MMKILHLIIDHQVIERMLGIFEDTFPECNDVIIFSDTRSYKHLNKYASCPRVCKKKVNREGKAFDFSLYNYIVAHYLTPEMIDFISYAPNSIHVSWEIYGYDLYNQFLEPLGYEIQSSRSDKYLSWKSKVMKIFGVRAFCLYLRTGDRNKFKRVIERKFKQIVNRLDSIEVGCIEDARLLEKFSRKKFVVYKAFNYSLKITLGNLYGRKFFMSDGILVGNSASTTNNHLYVLDCIKSFDLDNSHIIMPLSYGGTSHYKNGVISEYSKVFPNKVEYLMDYMPLHEYNQLFLRLKIMILASWRQESIGTVVMGLYLGIKIYMSLKSPLFRSLKEEGFIIYEIESLTDLDFLKPLSLDQKEHNRSLLLKNYDEKVFERELRRQFV